MNRQFSNDSDTPFNLGSRQLRNPGRTQELSLSGAPRKSDTEQRGADPYNTSGSFDRAKNWARVGRR